MKRTPLKRKTPLRAKRAIQRGAVASFAGSKTKHARRERGRDYMAWTATQPCIVRRFFDDLQRATGNRHLVLEKHIRCDGPIQVDHAGDRFVDGNGRRAFDRTVIPVCRKHHEQRTNACGTRNQAGIFFGFTCGMVRTWSYKAIEIHQALARSAGVAIPDC